MSNPAEQSILDVFTMMEASNAGIAKIEMASEGDAPFFVAICVSGTEECAEILAAVEAIEAQWDSDSSEVTT